MPACRTARLCEKDKDTLDRTEPLQFYTTNTIRTVITENGIRQDTIYWLFDDSTKRAPYAAYSQKDGVKKKLLSTYYYDGHLFIDDGETNKDHRKDVFGLNRHDV